MSPNPPTSHPLMKMGFRKRWQAKFILSPYPIQAAGFTLIELSIVLVIIGLITGGVLVGQDLIHAASIRATVSQVEKINTSVNTFRLKYNCLPGDCKNATLFFSTTSQPEQVQNGNGNKSIAAVEMERTDPSGCSGQTAKGGANANQTIGWSKPQGCSSGAYEAEWLSAWDHLAAAGLAIDGISQFDETSSEVQQGIQYPNTKLISKFTPLSGGYAFDHGMQPQGGLAFGWMPSISVTPYMKSGHKIMLTMCEDPLSTTGGNFPWCGMAPWDTRLIDLKIDDGRPFTGSMIILGWHQTYRTAYVWGMNNNGNGTMGCTTGPVDLGGTNEYRSEKGWDSQIYKYPCAPYIQASF